MNDPQRVANLLGALAIGLSDRIQAAVVGATGLDRSAAAALLAVDERPGQPIEHLRSTLDLTHSGAVRLVDRLEVATLVTREEGRDARSRGLYLTADGRRQAKQASAARLDVLEQFVGNLNISSVALLGEQLGEMLTHLPETRSDAWRICRFCDHRLCGQGTCPVGAGVA